MTAGSI